MRFVLLFLLLVTSVTGQTLRVVKKFNYEPQTEEKSYLELALSIDSGTNIDCEIQLSYLETGIWWPHPDYDQVPLVRTEDATSIQKSHQLSLQNISLTGISGPIDIPIVWGNLTTTGLYRTIASCTTFPSSYLTVHLPVLEEFFLESHLVVRTVTVDQFRGVPTQKKMYSTDAYSSYDCCLFCATISNCSMINFNIYNYDGETCTFYYGNNNNIEIEYDELYVQEDFYNNSVYYYPSSDSPDCNILSSLNGSYILNLADSGNFFYTVLNIPVYDDTTSFQYPLKADMTLEYCCQLCKNISKCTYFSWYDDSYNTTTNVRSCILFEPPRYDCTARVPPNPACSDPQAPREYGDGHINFSFDHYSSPVPLLDQCKELYLDPFLEVEYDFGDGSPPTLAYFNSSLDGRNVQISHVYSSVGEFLVTSRICKSTWNPRCQDDGLAWRTVVQVLQPIWNLQVTTPDILPCQSDSWFCEAEATVSVSVEKGSLMSCTLRISSPGFIETMSIPGIINAPAAANLSITFQQKGNHNLQVDCVSAINSETAVANTVKILGTFPNPTISTNVTNSTFAIGEAINIRIETESPNLYSYRWIIDGIDAGPVLDAVLYDSRVMCKSQVLPPPTPTTFDETTCTSMGTWAHWDAASHRCLYLAPSARLHWVAADSACREGAPVGSFGRLGVLNIPAFHAAIDASLAAIPGTYWVGARSETDGNYTWVMKENVLDEQESVDSLPPSWIPSPMNGNAPSQVPWTCESRACDGNDSTHRFQTYASTQYTGFPIYSSTYPLLKGCTDECQNLNCTGYTYLSTSADCFIFNLASYDPAAMMPVAEAQTQLYIPDCWTTVITTALVVAEEGEVEVGVVETGGVGSNVLNLYGQHPVLASHFQPIIIEGTSVYFGSPITLSLHYTNVNDSIAFPTDARVATFWVSGYTNEFNLTKIANTTSCPCPVYSNSYNPDFIGILYPTVRIWNGVSDVELSVPDTTILSPVLNVTVAGFQVELTGTVDQTPNQIHFFGSQNIQLEASPVVVGNQPVDFYTWIIRKVSSPPAIEVQVTNQTHIFYTNATAPPCCTLPGDYEAVGRAHFLTATLDSEPFPFSTWLPITPGHFGLVPAAPVFTTNLPADFHYFCDPAVFLDLGLVAEGLSTWNFTECAGNGTVSHTFTTAGFHVVALTASNPLDRATHNLTVEVQQPVDLLFQFLPPDMAFMAAPTQIQIVYPSEPLPSNVSAIVDWGDGSGVETIPLPFTPPCPCSFDIAHVFTNLQEYDLTVILQNNVSSESFALQVNVTMPFTHVIVDSWYMDEGLSKVGLGPDKLDFPELVPLFFNLTGVPVPGENFVPDKYRFTLDGVVTEQIDWLMEYSLEVGYHVIETAIGYRGFWLAGNTSSIRVHPYVRNFRVFDDFELIVQKNPKPYSIDTIYPLSDSYGYGCMTMDLGDGSNPLLFGDSESVCRENLAPTDAHSFQSLQAGVSLLNLNHVYMEPGDYSLSVTLDCEDGLVHGWNLVSETATSFPVTILPIVYECKRPDLLILGASYDTRTAPEKTADAAFVIEGVSRINCGEEPGVNRLWSLDEVDLVGNFIRHVDVSALPSHRSRKLVVPRYSFPAGYYLVTYFSEIGESPIKVPGVPFQSFVRSFIRIVAPPPVLVLLPGPESKLGRVVFSQADDIPLSPATLSYRSDLGPGNPVVLLPTSRPSPSRLVQAFEEIQLFCRQLLDSEGSVTGEVWPTLFDGSMDPDLVSAPLPEGERDTRRGTVTDEGGCFMQRERTSGSVVVEVTNSTLPTLSISLSCHKPALCPMIPWGHLINAGEDMVKFIASCPDDCNTYQEPLFSWEILAFDPLDLDSLLPDPSPLAINGITIDGGSEFSVQPGFFQYFPSVHRFAAKLTFSAIDAPHSTTYLYFERNDPPTGGDCAVSPSSGTTEDLFTISCTGWDDLHGIQYFQFFNIHSVPGSTESVEESIQMTYSEPALERKLRSGTYTLFTRIVDNYGASRVIKAGNVEVTQLAVTEEATAAAMMAAVTDADVHWATSLVHSLLDSHRLFPHICSFCPWPCTLNLTDCFGLPRNESDYGECIKSLEECEEEERVAGSQLRAELLEDLAKFPPLDPGDVAQMAMAIAHVFEEKRDVSAAGLEWSEVQLSKMIRLLANTWADLRPGEVRSLTKQISLLTGRQVSKLKWIETLRSGLEDPVEDPKAMKKALAAFDPSLPKDPTEIVYLEELTPKELSTQSAVAAFHAIAPKLAETVEESEDVLLHAQCADLVSGAPEFTARLDAAEFFYLKGQAGSVLSETIDGAEFRVRFPDLCALLGDNATDCDRNTTLLLVKVAHKSGNTFKYADSERKVSSGSSGVQLFDCANLQEINITNSLEPISIYHDSHDLHSTPELVQPVVTEHSIMAIHQINVTNTFASVFVELAMTNPAADMVLFIGLGRVPAPNQGFYDFRAPLAPANSSIQIDREELGNFTGMIHIGFAEISQNQSEDTTRVVVTSTNGSVYYNLQMTTNYTLRMYTAGCYFFDPTTQDWFDNGCILGPETSAKSSHCLCYHLTSFASGLFVAPNTIDFDYVFANFSLSKIPAIYLSLGVIFAAYIILVFFVYRMDRRDILKLGVTPLPDNSPKDAYLYQLVVKTGLWKGAATDSRVQFLLSGEHGESGVREMGDSLRPVFRRGQTNQFLMATKGPLGDLEYLRIFHDSSGSGSFASWFLVEVAVLDLQTGAKTHFLANRWLAVDKEDGMTERVIPVSSGGELSEFEHLFTSGSRAELKDGHIWVQRLSCCLCVLLTTMLTSAMWFGTVPEGRPSNALEIGPFAIAPETLGVGIMSNLIVFPINFIIMIIFRKARRRISQADEMKKKLAPKKTDKNKQQPKVITVSMDKSGKKSCSLPWWFRLVAWALWGAVVMSCAFFILMYGIQFGDEKARKWLSSIVLGFCTSVLLTQPIKIVLTAVFCACLCRKRELLDDEEDLESLYLRAHDEEYLHRIATTEPSPDVKDEYMLSKMRERYGKESRMGAILKELAIYAVFSALVVMMSYGNVAVGGYEYQQSLRHHLLGVCGQRGSNGSLLPCFQEVSTREEYWDWVRKTLVPGLRAARWYNGDAQIMQRGYLSDRVTRIMGYAVLRQVRIETGESDVGEGGCEVAEGASWARDCAPVAHLTNEEHRDFGPGWTPNQTSTRPEYRYWKSSKTEALPFLGSVSVKMVSSLNNVYFYS